MSGVIRIGLIGVGKMGQNHLRVLSLLKGVEIVFIYDANIEAAKKIAATYGVEAAIDLCDKLDDVDALVIASPTCTHAEVVKKVGGKVKNIFVEKPLAATLSEAQDLAEFAIAEGLNIQIGFIERFNPAVQATKRVLKRSGRVISVDFTRTNKLSSRITDVDVVTDLMIHDIDLAMYMNGPVKTVEAHGMAHGQLIDFASALLTHVNGSFSRIQASRITEKKMRMIQATCLEMFVDCDLLRKEINISRQSEISQLDGEPYTIASLEESIEVRPQEALLSELQVFVASCRGDINEDKPGIQDGLSAMIVCDQIQRAVLQ
jgi:predicted dehydrogenase